MKTPFLATALALLTAVGCTSEPQFDVRTHVQHASVQDPAQFVLALRNGNEQTIVAYGTSLTAKGTWVQQLKLALDNLHPNLATVVNAGKGAMWSDWGVANLEQQVLAHEPDAVFIEFAINDAFLEYETSVQDAQANLEQMIERILEQNSRTEVILMVMNPPTGVHLQRRPDINSYEEMYRAVAKSHGLRLIDFSLPWQHVIDNQPDAWRYFVPDGIHPNEHGCKQIITPSLLRGLGIDGVDPSKKFGITRSTWRTAQKSGRQRPPPHTARMFAMSRCVRVGLVAAGDSRRMTAFRITPPSRSRRMGRILPGSKSGRTRDSLGGNEVRRSRNRAQRAPTRNRPFLHVRPRKWRVLRHVPDTDRLLHHTACDPVAGLDGPLSQ